MRAAGMTFGSHTWSHRNLAQIGDAEVERELTRSKQVLEARLSAPVSAVAYPWGKLRRHVTDRTFAAAARAGYRLGAFSLPRAVRDSDAPLAIPRFGVGSEPVESLAGKVRGAIDWHGAVHERIPARLARALWRDEAGIGSARHDAAEPRVSAVVTTYNYARFLPDALDSMLAQTHANLEIVVVDDGSTDDTAAVVARLRRSAASATFAGRTAARGRLATPASRSTSAPLVAFLDADDAWLPDRVEAGRGPPRPPPRARARGRARLRLRRAAAPDRRRARRDPRDGAHARPAAHRQRGPQSQLRADPANGARSGGRLQRDPVRRGLGHLDRDREALPDRLHRPARSPWCGATRAASRRSVGVSVDVNRAIVERHLRRPTGPAWKRPLIRRRAASMAHFHAGVGSVKSGDRRAARRHALTSIALDPFTLARRKAKLLTRAFLPGVGCRTRRTRGRGAVRDLGRRAFIGFVWAAASYAGGRLLFFAATLVLARLLVPDEFGLVAFALAVIHYLEYLTDLGLGAALVYRSDAEDPKVSSTAFWIGIGGGRGAVRALLGARARSSATSDPTRASSPCSGCSPCTSSSRRSARPTSTGCGAGSSSASCSGRSSSAGLTKGVVSIALALAGAGAWSLIIGQLAGALCQSAALWIVYPWRPSFAISRTPRSGRC